LGRVVSDGTSRGVLQLDNWFDFKWLGRKTRKRAKELRVTPFSPNRVQTEKQFVRGVQKPAWISIGPRKPLYYRPADGPWLAQRIDQLAKQAAFIWYSGNTTTNKVGRLMLYLSGAGGYAWCASLRKGEHWTVADECGITRRELESFAERGRQLEVDQE
jgi:hypothetical protein